VWMRIPVAKVQRSMRREFSETTYKKNPWLALW
jgi:hypothetical protein